jgi:RimJ/RimL family protein N-acetyltransferase
MKEFLGNAVDKRGNKLTVNYSETFGSSPVVSFFMRNYADMIDDGHAHSLITGSNKSHVVYITHNDRVVASVVYDIQDDVYKTAWIVFTCVDPEYRDRGLYKILNKHFEQVVTTDGCKKISSLVHVNNEKSFNARKAIGYVPVFYRMEKEL